MKNNNNSRRSFLKKAVLGTAAIVSIPEILSAAMPPARKMKTIRLSAGQTILFQGD